MSRTPSPRLRSGDRVPSLELPAVPGGEPTNLRTHSRNALVLLLVPAEHGAWSDYLTTLARAAEEIEQWYARILVVVPGQKDHVQRLREQLPGRLTVLADAEEEVGRRLGVAAPRAALLIADRYGQVYEVAETGEAEELPGVSEIEEWVKFLATQCPECGVIDEPGYGEWALT